MIPGNEPGQEAHVQEDSQSLEARIARLENIESLRQLRIEYHQRTNDGDLHRLHELFSPDGRLDLGYFGTYIGRDAIAEGMAAMGHRGRFMVKHFMTAHTVQLAKGGSSATGACHLQACYALGGTSYLVAGCYRDKYVKPEDDWLFAEMSFTAYFSVPSAVGWAGDDLHWLHPAVAESFASISAAT
ncbi:MAG TPA: nuclear transport factor 2 family protein [Solirubrobacteraceae bacterium]|jgi:hypothetical protein